MKKATLLTELAPVAQQLYARHVAASREWFPHELVPYQRAREFVAGEAWSADDTDCGGVKLSEAVRAALFVNVLTEDNLPYYFYDIDRMFGRDHIWGVWARLWTAEEGRHSIVLRDYVTVTRALDLRELERARMVQVAGGETATPHDAHEGLIYVCLQELATRISHRNTGKLVGDSVADKIMAQVAFDENLHYLFYRDAATAALAIDPSGMMIAMNHVVRNFSMPGTGIPNFKQHARAIADAGIYNLKIHIEQILRPIVLRHWNIEAIAGLSDEAKIARDSLLSYIARLEKVSARIERDKPESSRAQVAV